MLHGSSWSGGRLAATHKQAPDRAIQQSLLTSVCMGGGDGLIEHLS